MECTQCQAELIPSEESKGLCYKCESQPGWYKNRNKSNHTSEQIAFREKEAAIAAILLTTEHSPGLPIEKRLDIITAECVFGMNIFRDMFAGIRDIVGGRSNATQHVLRDSRRTVLRELKREAHELGANAVIAVDLDYSEISGKGNNMLLVVASGTAVRLRQNDPC